MSETWKFLSQHAGHCVPRFLAILRVTVAVTVISSFRSHNCVPMFASCLLIFCDFKIITIIMEKIRANKYF